MIPTDNYKQFSFKLTLPVLVHLHVQFPKIAMLVIALQGRSQNWPKEGVLRREIAKGERFEGAKAWRIRVRMLFW